MGGKKPTPMLPEPWPEPFPIRLRKFQLRYFPRLKELKPAFPVRRRELLNPPLHLEEKHQPVTLPGIAVFADEAGQVQVAGREG